MEHGLAERRTRIDRARLAARVRAGLDAGPVLLVAGAGFGKSSLLDEALRERGGQVVWISCTAAEASPGRLLGRLIEGLRERVPGAADVLGERLAVAVESEDALAAVRELIAELRRLLADPLVVVLDDAEHLATSEPALRLVAELVRADIERLRVAIATRRNLPIKLAKLRTAGRVTELGPADLAFGAGECADFLRMQRGAEPEPDEVEALLAATEGWPLGVALGALGAPAGAAGADGFGPTLRSRDEVYEFFAEEVLDRLAPEHRAAVIDSAVPRELTPAIAAALGLPEGFLAEAERLGLFLRQRDAGRSVFGYHPLFREFLLERLAAERPETRRQQLHASVAPAIAAAGRPQEAIEHWLEAGYWPEVVAGLEREGPQLLRTSPDSLRAWIERLPAEPRADPVVASLEGRLDWAAGNHQRAAELLRAAIAGFQWRRDPGNEWVARFTLADVLFSLGRLDEAVGLAEGFDGVGAAGGGAVAAATAMVAATCLAAEGRIDESDRLAARALRDPQADQLVACEAMRRAFVDVPAGRIDEALARLSAAIAACADADPFARAAELVVVRALVLADAGRDAEAATDWARLERLQLGGPAPFLVGTAAVQRAIAAARAGRAAEAEAELARAGAPKLDGWRGYDRDVAEAWRAAARGDATAVVAAADAARARTAGAPVLDRFWVAAEIVPALAQAGQAARAYGVIDETLELCDRALGGERGPLLRARLHALRAWLRGRGGRDQDADEDLAAAWEGAGGAARHLVRREWPRLGDVVWAALERGVLDPASTMRVLATAFPEGAALIRFADHPVPAVRRAAVGPALASGHPDALVKLKSLEQDPDSDVQAAAHAAARGLAETAPPLVISILGRFAVRRGAWVVDDAAWGRPLTARLVRFLLVHRGAIVPEDLLFEAFWPDRATAAARRNLQVAISRARQVLDAPGREGSTIEVIERSYVLQLADQDLVDVDEFDAVASAALAERGTSRLALVERAHTLWGGEPLPEDRYAEWAVAWRERIVDRYIELLGALVEAYSAAGNHASAIQAARELVDLDPLNEHAHRELMASYARAGRTGHALRQYLECRRTLIDELGVEPAEPTNVLQARILAGQPV